MAAAEEAGARFARFDTHAFRNALSYFATAMAVVTAAIGTRILAPTVNSFKSVWLDPPLLLFSVTKASANLADLLAA